MKWFSYRVRDRDLVSVFHIWISSFPNIICLKRLSFFQGMFLAPSIKITWLLEYRPFLGLLFFSIGLHFCFDASTMLILLPYVCSVIWSQVLWYLQHCPFCSGLVWLFGIFYVFVWFQGWLFYFCEEWHWILMGITLTEIAFGSIAIFTILILPIHEQGRSFHLVVSSSIISSIFYSFHCRGILPP
jgi:hypothetical protein